MRQEKREIKDNATLEAIIRKASVCRLAMCRDNVPYIVPMNFGYADQTLYFHCAAEGKKIDWLRQNSRVAFELEGTAEIEQDPKLACQWNTRFQSIIGEGRVEFILDPEEKIRALKILMSQYTNQTESLAFAEKPLQLATVFKVVITAMTGKQSKHFLSKDTL